MRTLYPKVKTPHVLCLFRIVLMCFFLLSLMCTSFWLFRLPSSVSLRPPLPLHLVPASHPIARPLHSCLSFIQFFIYIARWRARSLARSFGYLIPAFILSHSLPLPVRVSFGIHSIFNDFVVDSSVLSSLLFFLFNRRIGLRYIV